MSIRDRLKITRRGYNILREYCPGLIETKILFSLIESGAPFINIWFSAKIINEIANLRRIKVLGIYVIFTILINLIFSIIKSVVDRVSSAKEASMWDCFSKIFCDKQMSVEYEVLEKASYQQQKQKAEENLFMFGNGLGQLVWNTPRLIRVFVGIFASIALSISLFTSKCNNNILNSKLWILVIVAMIVFEGWIHDKYKNREQKVFNDWSDGTVWFNRTFAFYGQELDLDLQRAKDVRIYRQDIIALNKIDKMIAHNIKDDSYISKMSLYQGISSFWAEIINSLCYIFIALKTFYGAFPVGNMVQYISSLKRLTESFGELTLSIAENKIYCEHLKKLFEYLDIDASNENNVDILENVVEKEICIEFKNVSFKYPGSDTYVLRNINAKFHSGKRYAIVGMNGSGKTTFVKLLCRLYAPTEGAIYINGIDVKRIDYKEYLKNLAVVFQDFQLFSFGVGQNVSVNTDYDKLKVEQCLMKAGVYDRVSKMSDKLETCLYRDFSENGVEISGGEAQKIALARALYKEASVMILDEPTAALDPIAEEEVYTKFSEIRSEGLTIYISHRLSSCKFCDSVNVFDCGTIVQKGTHDELVANKQGKYYELWNAQAQYYRNSSR